MKKYSYLFLSFALLLLTLASCHDKDTYTPNASPRVVALTPSLASTALSVAPNINLVATSVYTTWPDDAVKVASLPTPAPIEQIIRLRPDLVLLHPSDVQLIGKLEKLHIPTLVHSMDTIADIQNTLMDIAASLNMPQSGENEVKKLMASLDNALPQNLPKDPVPFLFIIDVLDARMQKLYIAQNDAYLSELARRCNGAPIVVNDDNWTQISAETLLRLDPQNIIFLNASDASEKYLNQFKTLYADLKAVQNNRIVALDDPGITTPDMRLPRTQAILCDAIISFLK